DRAPAVAGQMKPMGRFRAHGAQYAVPVEDVRQVRTAEDLSFLPMSRTGVAGLVMGGELALPVLSVLGAEGDRLLVLEADGRRFGLLVDEVSGVVDEGRVAAPPAGQASPMITGVLDSENVPALVIDAGV